MSDRLTHSAQTPAPTWTRLALPALLLITAAVLARFHGAAPTVIPDEAHPLYRLLPGFHALFMVQDAFLLLLCLGSGLLLRRMLPAKTAPATRTLAAALGVVVPPMLLSQIYVDAIAALPSMALLVFSWLLFLSGKEAKRFLSASAGLLAGLSLCLDPLSLAGVAPVAVWLTVSAIASGKTGGVRLLLWLIGLGIGILPIFTDWVGFDLGLEAPLQTRHLRLLFMGHGPRFLPHWALPFVLLGLLAGLLQRQKVLLGLVLPTFALQLLGWTFQPLLMERQALAALAPLAWLTAYGLFRLLRGVEQGVRNVNAKKAKTVPLFFIGFTLAAYAGWAVWLYLPARL